MSSRKGFALTSAMGYFIGCFYGEMTVKVPEMTSIFLLTASLPFLFHNIRNLNLKLRMFAAEIITNKTALFLFILLSSLIIPMISDSSLKKEGDNYVASTSVWGDIPIHLNHMNSFVQGENRFLSFSSLPRNPIYAGGRLAISFFPDFHSALLRLSGLTDREAMIVPNIINNVAFLMLLFLLNKKLIGTINIGFSSSNLLYQLFPSLSRFFAPAISPIEEGEEDGGKKTMKRKRALKNQNLFDPSLAALVSVLIFVFSGGVGFLYWIKLYGADWSNMDFDFIEKYSDDHRFNLFWFAVFPHVLLPQRNAIYALPLVCIVLLSLYESLKPSCQPKKQIALSFLSGLVVSLLPLVQTQSMFGLIVIAASIMILHPADFERSVNLAKWLCFFFPVVILALPQIYVFLMGSGLAEIFKLSPIWLEDDWSFETFGKGIFSMALLTPLFFWLRSLGLLFVTSLIATLFVRNSTHRKFAIGAWGLFLVANLVCFNTWKYDNIKFFYIWLIIMSGVISLFLARLFHGRSFLFKILAAVLVILMIFSGVLAVRRDVHNRFTLFTEEDVTFSRWISSSTSPTSRFFTSQRHINPVTALAGRTVFAGYSGWIFSQGFEDWEKKGEDIRKVFSGSEEAMTILKDNLMDYVVIDNDIRYSDYFNGQFWENTRFPIVHNEGQYTVYEIWKERYNHFWV